VLEVSGLRKSYGGRVALNDVSFEAQRGELVGCIGPNGAGKTTLLSIVAGVRKPDAGAVSLASPGSDSPGSSSFKVGWVPQQQALYGKLSAEENLKLFARLDGVQDVDGEVARMLDRIDLSGRSGEQVSRLSGGNRQRVNVAVGLLGNPDLLLLDEPSAALDPGQRERLWSLILTLAREGTTVLYSTHNVIEAERYADRVLVLADGDRVFWGPPGELREELAEGAAAVDFEEAFVSFLRQRGH
jgi:ABC-2 type transport system ATP-binding protein